MKNKPIRIQRKRTKGFNLQAQSPDGREVVSVCRPGKWGNPYIVQQGLYGTKYKIWYCIKLQDLEITAEFFEKKEAAASFAIQQYQEYILDNNLKPEIQAELKGKHLACFCKLGEPCHADTLLELANQE
jgi:ribosomal protein L34